MDTKAKFIIRKRRAEDGETILKWMLGENWTARREFDDFLSKLPYGHDFVAEDNNDGRLLGAIGYWCQRPNYALICYYIVSPDDRGRGIGTALWKHAFEQLEGCNVGISSVEMTKKYREGDFRVIGVGLRRYTVPVEGLKRALKSRSGSSPAFVLTAMTTSHADQVVAFVKASQGDTEPCADDEFFPHYVAYMSDRRVIATSASTGETLGFAFLGPGKLGSWYATDDDVALAIVEKLLEEVDETCTSLFLGVCELKTAIVELIESIDGAKLEHMMDRSYTKHDEFPPSKLKYFYNW